jgi:hypothetical protein
MKRNNMLIFCMLILFYIVSCTTTQTSETPNNIDDSAELAMEDEAVRVLAESVEKSSRSRESMSVPARLAPTIEPAADTYHIDYHEFGPDKVTFVVSIPNNTDQEINAIIWLWDDTIVDSSFFDLKNYPAGYKEKYIIAIMPYKFKSGDVRIKNIRNSIGDVTDFVKVIAKDHQIDLNRIILVGYTTGRFSMAYL